MKKFIPIMFVAALAAFVSCTEFVNEIPDPVYPGRELTLSDVAKILSELPLEQEHLEEVYDAVSSSSRNGYDEEYLMSSLFNAPGCGVGENGTRAERYARPLRELLSSYFESRPVTRGGSAEDCIRSLVESDMQIYWPYSEDWDGETYPVVTFDPGYGAESNWGYELRSGSGGGLELADSVFVDESVAQRRPVWVINTNDDRSFTPVSVTNSVNGGPQLNVPGQKTKLILKNFTMFRNYDSWFGGASEFCIKVGAIDGFKAADEGDLKLYTPSVTDFLVVIKRKQLGLKVPLDIVMLTDFTDQMEKIAFLITEDDGGTSTAWKASTVVKVNSKQYGFDINLPYKDSDDIVWRGQLDTSFFNWQSTTDGRFGDVKITFEIR